MSWTSPNKPPVLPALSHQSNENHQQQQQQRSQDHSSACSKPDGKDGDKPTEIHSRIPLEMGDDDDPEGQYFASRCQRKRIVLPIAAIVIIIAVGAVMGGVLGTAMSRRSSSTTDNSPYVDVSSRMVMHPRSQVARTFDDIGPSNGVSVSVFVTEDDDDDLVATEWYERKEDTYLIQDRAGGAKIPKPRGASPLHFYGTPDSGDLHLYYIDQDIRLAHMIRRSYKGDDSDWEIGPLATEEGRQLLPDDPAGTMRLAVTVMPKEWGESEYMIVMYQAAASDNTLVVLSSDLPKAIDSWVVQEVLLQSGAGVHTQSTRLVALPYDAGKNGKPVPGLRIIWDVDNDETAFGGLECTFTSEQQLEACSALPIN